VFLLSVPDRYLAFRLISINDRY